MVIKGDAWSMNSVLSEVTDSSEIYLTYTHQLFFEQHYLTNMICIMNT